MNVNNYVELVHAAMSQLASDLPLLDNEGSLQTHLTAALNDLLDSGEAIEDKDVLIRDQQKSVFVELKYAHKKFIGCMGGGDVHLKTGALDASCHGFLLDVADLEERVSLTPESRGLALFLTNHPAAWSPSIGTQWDEFRIHSGRPIHGVLRWKPETSTKTKRKYPEMVIHGTYQVTWQDFATVPGNGAGVFRYGVIAVDPLPATYFGWSEEAPSLPGFYWMKVTAADGSSSTCIIECRGDRADAVAPVGNSQHAERSGQREYWGPLIPPP
jgi:hypothetical protein